MSRDVQVTLRANVSQYVSALQQAAAATKQVSASGVDMQKLGGNLQSFGRTATMAVSAPMVAMGGAAVAMSNRFGQTFTRMNTLAGISANELGGMRQAVLDLSRETGRGPQELANALYEASSSGLNAEQSLDAVTIAAKGAASGLGNTQDIISLVASATASYGAENMSAAKATDILIGTIRAGRADPDELAGSLGRVLPVASALGVEFEEVGGVTARLSTVFGDTNRTVTSVSGVLQKLSAPTQAGREALEAYGTSFENLRRIVADEGLVSAFQHLRDIGLSDDPLAFKALFDDVEARQGAQAIIDNLGAVTTAIDEVKGSAGALNDIWSATQGDPGFKMAQSIARVQTALIEFGDAIGPTVASASEGVAQIMSAFASLPQGVQMAIAGALIAIGPLTTMAGTLMKNAATIRAALAIITGSSATAGAAVGAGALAAGTAALAAGIVGVGAYASYQGIDWLMGGGMTDYSEGEARQRRMISNEDRIRFFGGSVSEGYTDRSDSSMTRLLGPSMPASMSRDPLDPGAFGETPVRDRFAPTAAMRAYVDALRDYGAQVVAMKETSAQYQQVVTSRDWGATRLAGAQAAAAQFNEQLFGMQNISANAHASYDGLAGVVSESSSSIAEAGFQFDLTSEKGRAGFSSLQQVAAATQPLVVAALDSANGSFDAFARNMEGVRASVVEGLAASFQEAGMSAEQATTAAAAFADQLGLTPEHVRTVFELSQMEEARQKLELMQGLLETLPPEVQTQVMAEINEGDFIGAMQVIQDYLSSNPAYIDAVAGDFGEAAAAFAALTGVQRQAVIDAIMGADGASGPLSTLTDAQRQALIDAANGDFSQAEAALSSLTAEQRQALIDAISGSDSASPWLQRIVDAIRNAPINAVQGADRVSGWLNSLAHSRTVYFAAVGPGASGGTSYRYSSSSGTRNPIHGGAQRMEADGGVYGPFGLRRFAGGGLAGGLHDAMLMPHGDTLFVWREPETMGESFIPHAPGKRGRSIPIWEQTGRILGVYPFAAGGMAGGSSGGQSAGLSPSFDVRVFVGDREITDIVRTEMRQRDLVAAAGRRH